PHRPAVAVPRRAAEGHVGGAADQQLRRLARGARADAFLTGPDPPYLLQHRLEASAALIEGNARSLEVVGTAADGGAEDEAALRDVVDRQRLLGHQRRVRPVGEQQDVRHQADALPAPPAGGGALHRPLRRRLEPAYLGPAAGPDRGTAARARRRGPRGAQPEVRLLSRAAAAGSAAAAGGGAEAPLALGLIADRASSYQRPQIRAACASQRPRSERDSAARGSCLAPPDRKPASLRTPCGIPAGR